MEKVGIFFCVCVGGWEGRAGWGVFVICRVFLWSQGG